MLSTKDIAESNGGGLPKIIKPGHNSVKINSVELKQFDWMKQDGAYHVQMNVETKPIEGFEGFFIDPENESLGRYAGQIGQVKMGNWPYKDGVTKGGTVISRDADMLKALKQICVATNCVNWLEAQDGKHETVESLYEAFNKEQPFADKYIKMCVACREYPKANSTYPGQDLHLPKGKMNFVTMEAEDAKVSKLLPFDEAEHWKKYVADSVGAFNGGDEAAEAPEFEL